MGAVLCGVRMLTVKPLKQTVWHLAAVPGGGMGGPAPSAPKLNVISMAIVSSVATVINDRGFA